MNRDKTDFATKQRKSHKREILQQNSIKCNKTSKIVHIIYFVMVKQMTDLSPHFSCGEISPCDRFSPHLKGTISAFNLKFLHMAEFFSTGTACGACDKYEVWNDLGAKPSIFKNMEYLAVYIIGLVVCQEKCATINLVKFGKRPSSLIRLS